MKYTVWIEGDEYGYSAVSPDVPGLIATGQTCEETLDRVRTGIPVHLATMRASNLSMPVPAAGFEDAPEGMTAIVIELEPYAVPV